MLARHRQSLILQAVRNDGSARVSDLTQQRRPRMGDQPVSVRRDIYRETAPSALHLQGEPPEQDPADVEHPQNRRSGGQFRGGVAGPSGKLQLVDDAVPAVAYVTLLMGSPVHENA